MIYRIFTHNNFSRIIIRMAGCAPAVKRRRLDALGAQQHGNLSGMPHFMNHIFRIVRDNLKGGNRTTKDRLIPFCIFTDPELARVGLNESEAKNRGIDYRVVSMPMAAVLRTRTLSEPRGFLKMLIDAHSDRILGFTVLGVEASELMATVRLQS
jgi:pyruvate/2-oxoglutarate dehydrogenase complex dihydrolipoamide dehydrogenase (E3) component